MISSVCRFFWGDLYSINYYIKISFGRLKSIVLTESFRNQSTFIKVYYLTHNALGALETIRDQAIQRTSSLRTGIDKVTDMMSKSCAKFELLLKKNLFCICSLTGTTCTWINWWSREWHDIFESDFTSFFFTAPCQTLFSTSCKVGPRQCGSRLMISFDRKQPRQGHHSIIKCYEKVQYRQEGRTEPCGPTDKRAASNELNTTYNLSRWELLWKANRTWGGKKSVKPQFIW